MGASRCRDRADAAPASQDLRDLARRLEYDFADATLLGQALTHGSAVGGGLQSNERLEFLGDAVLELAVAESLYRSLPDASEGHLTKLRSHFVRTRQLAKVARGLDVGPCLRLGKGEEQAGGRKKERLLANAFEAIVGAVYLDGGLAAASRVIDKVVLGAGRLRVAEQSLPAENAKSALQEWLQARGRPLPRYVVVAEEGTPQSRKYTVEARSDPWSACGEGGSKRAAAEPAAAQLLRLLKAAPEQSVAESERSAE